MTTVRIRSEEKTYERHRPVSYFKDLIAKSQGNSPDATARLDRHAKEMEVEKRANPDRTQGQGGYFAPPGWLIGSAVTARRPGRVLADLVAAAGNAYPLPLGVQSLNIPLLTTGTLDEPDQDLAGDPEQDVLDTFKLSPVVTISGQSDVALALLEQSPPGAHLDAFLFKDLIESYDSNLDQQMLYGSGVNGQFTGICQAVTSSNTITYTDASPTLTAMYTSIGKAFAQVGDNRRQPPEVWLARSARWAWIGASEDSSLRPVMVPNDRFIPTPSGSQGATPFGSMLGIGVCLDDNVSATLGSTSTQDQIVACRPSDLWLFEGEAHNSVFLEVLSGDLGARIQLRNYAAFLVGQASSIATVGGTGFVVQSGE